MIIGLCGLPGCGKDTAANVLKTRMGYEPMGFSDSLKRTVADLFGYRYEMLQARTLEDREIRSSIDHRYNKTPVKILEEVGLKMREVYPEIFLNKTLDSIRHSDCAVITDVRYPNEVDAIIERGGQVWKIERGELPLWVEKLRATHVRSNHNIDPNSFCLWDADSNSHIHEAQWRLQCSDMDERFTHVIQNDGTQEEFEDFVCKIL